MNMEMAEILLKWIEKNNNNAFSIFELNEDGEIKFKKVENSEQVELYINPELEKLLKEKKFSEEEIKTTITEMLKEIIDKVKELKKEDKNYS